MYRGLLGFAFFLLGSCWQVQASAQLAYADADNPGEAIGMMSTTLAANRALLSQCSSRYPANASEFYEGHRTWEEAERPAIRVARHYWNQMSKRDPRFHEMIAYAETVVAKQFEMLDSAPPALRSAVTDTKLEYCRQHFADLAAGVWRTRTPRMYRFLDEAPAPPAAPGR